MQQMNKGRSEEDPAAASSGSESDEDYKYVSVPSNLRGVARGQKALLNSTRRILKSQDPLTKPHVYVPHVINFSLDIILPISGWIFNMG